MRLLPVPILPQPHLCITRIVEINLANRGLDERPDAPIEARRTAEEVDFRKELVHVAPLVLPIQKTVVAGEIVLHEVTALRARGEDGEVAVEAAPLGEVVCDVEGCG